MSNPEQLSAFVEWYQRCITGDEKGQAQIFLGRIFRNMVGTRFTDVSPRPQFLLTTHSTLAAPLNSAY